MGVFKKVYMYDTNMNLIKEFETTPECAEYLNKELQYVNYNIKYYDKIWFNNKWYILKREKIEDNGKL